MPGSSREVPGVVAEQLPRALYRVVLETGHEVVAHASGDARRNFIRILNGDRVLVGDDEGTLWVFRSTCEREGTRCGPIDRFPVTSTALHAPAIDGDQAVVGSTGGVVARVQLDCRSDEDCDRVLVRELGSRALAPAVEAPQATIAGARDGSIEAFTW